ncbi:MULTISPECIES: hypothetical protein [Geodermatophilus]|uniref:Uncharacterized protein n=1 Tax=Geodermatophilus arenarius TaxID=1137990 RepID=A0ABV9LMI4_9ACTN
MRAGGVQAGGAYLDGIRSRLLLAVLVGLGAALLHHWLDDEVTATVLVGLVTVAAIALTPSPPEPAGGD